MYGRLALPLILGLAAIEPSLADEGRIPIFSATLISESGHYFLTRNIATPPETAGLVIAGSRVTLDLNGFSVTTTVAGPALPPRIQIETGGFKEITIRNGTLSGGSAGIQYTGTGLSGLRLTVEEVDFDSNFTAGIDLTFQEGARAVTVTSCSFLLQPNFGIRVDSPGSVAGQFTDNVMWDVGGGIRVSSLFGGLVRNNRLTNVDGVGILLQGSFGNRIEGNAITGSDISPGDGIVLDVAGGNEVMNNAIYEMNDGFSVNGNGNRLVSNTIRVSGNNGGRVQGDHNVLERNSFTLSQSVGLEIFGSYNLIDGNLIEASVGTGLWFTGGSSNAYRGNMLRNNTTNVSVTPGSATDNGGNIL